MKDGIRNENKKLYDAKSNRIQLINVPEFNFIMIDGIGNPRTEEFHLKQQALHILSQEIREYFKKNENFLYLISPLEGLWDTYDNSHFDVTRKKLIKFTLMMAQPRILDENTFQSIKQHVANKKLNPYIVDVYLKKYTEGLSVQMLHIGSYHDEINTTKKIMEYITIQNMKLKGFHHEIYLNDSKKVPEKKLRTIVRYSIEEQ